MTNIYIYMCTPYKILWKKCFLKMTKPAKPVSDLINCSLDMGINKFSVKLHCRRIPSTLFVLFSLPPPLQIPLKVLLSHQISASPTVSLHEGTKALWLAWQELGSTVLPCRVLVSRTQDTSISLKPSAPRTGSCPALIPVFLWTPCPYPMVWAIRRPESGA